MEKLDVIEKIHESTEWVYSVTVVTKPNGKLRIYIDTRDLNQAIRHEYYPMRTIEEIAACMPNAKIISVLDASSVSGKFNCTMKVQDCARSILPLVVISLNDYPLAYSLPMMCSKV